MHHLTAAALAAIASCVTPAVAHSWVEQLTLIDAQGTFTGTPGYIRNFIPRSAPGFTDTSLVHILPPSDPLEARDVDTNNIKPTDPMCRKSQLQQAQSNGFPRLSASPGSMIALRYEENGHVTLPQNQPGKPANRGNVTVYGTTQPRPNENFLDIFKQWNEAGTGGDKRGRLLATQPFDDGRCYQKNGGAISQQRQQQYPHSSDKVTGEDLWCQNDFKLPADVPTGKPYTLYWVWDWPTQPGADPGLPQGKAEIYTSCMDIDIKTSAQRRSLNDVRAIAGQDFSNMAISSYMSSMTQPAASSAPAQPAQPVASSAPAPAQPAQPAASSPVAGGSVQEKDVVTTATSKPAQATATVSQTMDLLSAEAIVFSAVGAQLVSQIAAEAIGNIAVATKTVTQTQLVAATASAQSSAVSGPAQENPAAQKPVAQSPAAQGSAVPTASTSPSNANTAATSSSAVPSMPPTSLNIKPPMMSPTSAGAPISATPVFSGLPTFSGTATPVALNQTSAATGTAGKGSCSAGSCRKIKRSRIFGVKQ